MKVSGTLSQGHPQHGGLAHARWSGWRGSQGFGSVLGDKLGAGAGKAASTATASAAQATTVAAAASQPQGSTVLGETAVSATAAAPASVSQSQAALVLGETPVAVPAAAQSGASQACRRSGGIGLTTASGAPLIVMNTQVPSTCSYKGPAAYNPYGSVFQAGAVVGYDKWFQTINIGTLEPNSTAVGYSVDPKFSANLEGGEEALRLVQQFVPGAALVSHYWPSQLPGQSPSYDVLLPNGTVLDGGLVLTQYYNAGYGVNVGSDAILEDACGLWPTSGTAS